MITAGRLHRVWRGLPFGSVEDVIGRAHALILAPHPDDESLGCGGLIARCCAVSRPPVVAILTDGRASHPGSALFPPDRLAALREQEASAAVGCLGLSAERLFFLRERDTRAPRGGPDFETLVRRLAELAQRYDCSSILAPWRLDPHCDHEAAALLAAAVAQVTGVRLVSYPVWGWTLPDDEQLDVAQVRGWRLDIAGHMDARRQAIAAHASQYGAVITDDPAGFRLPDALLRALDQPWETFLLP